MTAWSPDDEAMLAATPSSQSDKLRVARNLTQTF